MHTFIGDDPDKIIRLAHDPAMLSQRSGSKGDALTRELPLDHASLELSVDRPLEDVHSVTMIERAACHAKVRFRSSPPRACYELGQKPHRNADSTVGLVPSRSPFSAYLSCLLSSS